MIAFYVMRLENGATHWERIPQPLREGVRQMLIDQGKEHLIGGA